MNNRQKNALAVVSSVLAELLLAALVAAVLFGGGFLALPLLLVVGLVDGWMLYAYLYYRWGRQDELVQLLATATQAGTPLPPALRAYLRDQPRGTYWPVVPLFFLVPGLYWFWRRRYDYDARVARLARLLEEGDSLRDALRSVNGIVPRATTIAVAVGEATGRLALSLRRSTEGSLAVVWLEVLPRLLYPIMLLLFMIGVGTFWALFLLPRMERIYHDFGMELPALTSSLVDTGPFLVNFGGLITLGVLICVTLLVLAIVNPGVRWHVPGLGRLDRMNVQSRVLKMLGVLVEAGKPLPEALAVLADSSSFPEAVQERLSAAGAAVELGEPLPDSLLRAGLLSSSMVPLIRAAERSRNLGWALGELGDSLSGRAARLLRRSSLALFPAAVVAVGVLVALMVLGMFLPLVKLISELA
jgi:type IV pilus assembly protein PilC